MISFRDFLESEGNRTHYYIDPLTKRKWRHGNRVEQLKVILNDQLKKGVKSSELWVHFGQIPKLGFNPRSGDGGTPAGIFAYPLEYVIKKLDGGIGFGSRPYMIVFKVRNKKNILSIKDLSRKQELKRKNKFAFNDDDIDIFLKNKEVILKKFFSNVLSKVPGRYHPIFQKTIFKLILEAYNSIFSIFKNNKRAYHYLHPLQIATRAIDEVFTWAENYIQEKIEKDLMDIVKFFDNMQYKDKNKTLRKYVVQSGDGKINIYYNYRYVDYIIKKKFHGANKNFMQNKIREFLSKVFTDSNLPNEPSLKTKQGQEIADKIKSFNLINDLFQKYNLTEMMDKLKKQLNKKIFNFIFTIKQNSNKKIPYQDAIFDTLKQYGIKPTEILSSLNPLEYNNDQEFIYKISEKLARIINAKNDLKLSPNLIWTNILRKMGVRGLVDFTNQGKIHPAEPTQGFFFELKNLETIIVIPNQSDFLGDKSPDYMNWNPAIGKHFHGGTKINKARRIDSQRLKTRNLRFLTLKMLTLKLTSQTDLLSTNRTNFQNLTRTIIYTINFLKTIKKFVQNLKKINNIVKSELRLALIQIGRFKANAKYITNNLKLYFTPSEVDFTVLLVKKAEEASLDVEETINMRLQEQDINAIEV